MKPRPGRRRRPERLVLTSSRVHPEGVPGRLCAERRPANVKAADQTKKLILIAMYALLGLAVACGLSACFPSAEGKQPKAAAEEPKPPNVVLILTDDLT